MSETRRLPRHVGIIMDGNGRWAQNHGRPRLDGHRAGADSVRDITRASRQVGIEALTLYAFSSQNWARPAEEVAGLMLLLREFLIDERSEILDNQIRLEAIGDVEKLPPMVKEPLDELRAASAHHTGMTLTLALSYGEDVTAVAREQLVAFYGLLPGTLRSARLEETEAFARGAAQADRPAAPLPARAVSATRPDRLLGRR